MGREVWRYGGCLVGFCQGWGSAEKVRALGPPARNLWAGPFRKRRRRTAFPISGLVRPVLLTHVLRTLLSRFALSPGSRCHCPWALLAPTPPVPSSSPGFAHMIYCTQIPLVSSLCSSFYNSQLVQGLSVWFILCLGNCHSVPLCPPIPSLFPFPSIYYPTLAKLLS